MGEERYAELDAGRGWLVAGGPAVILQPWDRSTLRAEAVTIDRVLKRDVVLSNGERYRVDTLKKQVGGTWGTWCYLVAPDDPRVAKTRAMIRAKKLRFAAETAFDIWRRDRTIESAAAVIEAFTPLATSVTAGDQ